jgi:putative SOS response-associated peptidase YedK
MTRNREAIGRLFHISHHRMPVIDPLTQIFPGWPAPVIRKAADGEREATMLTWGFVLLQDGRTPKRVTNTRDDKISSPFWKHSFELRRCLVPASSFCEAHDARKPATWHWIALKGEEPRPLFAFPGIWRQWKKGPVKKEGPNLDIDVYSFMTTLPNALTVTINHARMPVVLTEEHEFETWLSGTPKEAFGLVRSFEADRMRIVQEGFDKEDLLVA